VKNGIQWESDQHLRFANSLFERIAYFAIKGSMELAKERGKYPLFDGSEWSKGIFFGRTPEENQRLSQENGNNFDWIALAEEVKRNGMRNAYLLAPYAHWFYFFATGCYSLHRPNLCQVLQRREHVWHFAPSSARGG
jgi:ribonucleotide reductase alpha subunit